jgi:hypothetical protein
VIELVFSRQPTATNSIAAAVRSDRGCMRYPLQQLTLTGNP